MTARTIDLNADVGEATDPDGIAVERALIAQVTTVHVACGGHAGDDDSMIATVAAALEHSVRVGAHPGYPDREGFGRRPFEMARAELHGALGEQLSALERVCWSSGTSIASIKPHGALYEEVAKGGVAYEAFRDAARDVCGIDVPVVMPSGCRAMAMALRDGLAAREEGFCDRAYRPDGGLVGRQESGAILSDPDAAVQAVSLARGAVVAHDGSVLTLWVDTLCVHGDSPRAVVIATAVRRAMAEAGIAVAAPDPW